jgi:hypothetical protein
MLLIDISRCSFNFMTPKTRWAEYKEEADRSNSNVTLRVTIQLENAGLYISFDVFIEKLECSFRISFC